MRFEIFALFCAFASVASGIRCLEKFDVDVKRGVKEIQHRNVTGMCESDYCISGASNDFLPAIYNGAHLLIKGKGQGCDNDHFCHFFGTGCVERDVYRWESVNNGAIIRVNGKVAVCCCKNNFCDPHV